MCHSHILDVCPNLSLISNKNLRTIKTYKISLPRNLAMKITYATHVFLIIDRTVKTYQSFLPKLRTTFSYIFFLPNKNIQDFLAKLPITLPTRFARLSGHIQVVDPPPSEDFVSKTRGGSTTSQKMVQNLIECSG